MPLGAVRDAGGQTPKWLAIYSLVHKNAGDAGAFPA